MKTSFEHRGHKFEDVAAPDGLRFVRQVDQTAEFENRQYFQVIRCSGKGVFRPAMDETPEWGADRILDVHHSTYPVKDNNGIC